MKVTFRDQNAALHFAPYVFTKNTALVLRNEKTREDIAIITANIPTKIPKDVLLIINDRKDSSDIQDLIEHNVIQSEIVAEYEHQALSIHAYRLSEEANEIRLEQYEKYRYDEILL